MLSPRLTNCPECANIPSLLKKIDCKLAELGNNLYNNVSYMLNKSVPAGDILQLMAYRRILSYKYCNPNYANKYSVQMIASKVIRLTAGCVSRCNTPEPCLEEPCNIDIVPNPSTTTTTTTVVIETFYVPSNLEFTNPERGQYKYTSTGDTEIYNQLVQEEVDDYRIIDGITLILRIFRLDAFISSPISEEYLSNMQTDFDIVRQSKTKMIIRFSYTEDIIDPIDATKSVMLGHIAQLKTLLSTNFDIIASVEAGFIGAYGEWAYSNNFGNTDTLTPTNITDRTEVGLAILDMVPNDMVAFRTPQYQQMVVGVTPIATIDAYNGSPKSRAAAHNDCYLSNATDFGTYRGDGVADKAYLQLQSKYTFTGGETCDLSSYNDCPNVFTNSTRFNFTYLNADYNLDVWDKWIADGCYDEIKRKLGYRYELVSSTISGRNLTINIINVGFGHLFKERPVYLKLKEVSTLMTYDILTTADIRYWLSGETNSINTFIDSSVLPGTYSVGVFIPDPLAVTNYPETSIRFANLGTWDSVTGYNMLANITII